MSRYLRRVLHLVLPCAWAFALASAGGCDSGRSGSSAAGGTVSTGGRRATGGAGGTVAASGASGGAGAGGPRASGGTGGGTSNGGNTASATVIATGGVGGTVAASGGVTSSSGGISTGGTIAGGGALGGRPSTGGTIAAGGALGGRPSTGGSIAVGGTADIADGGATVAKGGSTGTGGATATFKNPLNQDHGSDPWMLYVDGNYYLVATSWAETIDIRKSPTIAGLKTAQPVRVWTGDDPSRCCNVWAPEFHLLDGPNGRRWYLYYVAGRSGSNYDYQRSHVLESAGTDPLGPYTYKGQLLDASTWAIDPTILVLGGKLYLLYSSWSGSYQSLYISAMTNPWTTTGSRVLIAKPTSPWEQQDGSNVNEGPEVLQHGGKTFVVFSASGCNGPDYKLGMLTLTGSNPLDAAAWTKSPGAVFQRNDSASVFGPGHNGFFVSPDGSEDWIVYHAQSAVTGGCDNNRTSRAQPFTWNNDGTPNFGVPLSTSTALPVPSGE